MPHIIVDYLFSADLQEPHQAAFWSLGEFWAVGRQPLPWDYSRLPVIRSKTVALRANIWR